MLEESDPCLGKLLECLNLYSSNKDIGCCGRNRLLSLLDDITKEEELILDFFGKTSKKEFFDEFFYGNDAMPPEQRISFPYLRNLLKCIDLYNNRDVGCDRTHSISLLKDIITEEELILGFLARTNLETFYDQFLSDPGALKPELGINDPYLKELLEWLNVSGDRDSDIFILDIGCGQGRLPALLAYLKENPKNVESSLPNINYVGVDRNLDRLHEAENYMKQKSILSSAEFYEDIKEVEDYVREHAKDHQRPFKFDYVFLINVLHEISIDILPGLLKYLTLWLKHHGFLVIQDLSVLPDAEYESIPWNLLNLFIMFSRLGLQLDWQLHKSKGRSLPVVQCKVKKTMEDFEYIEQDAWILSLLNEVIPSMRIKVEYLQNKSKIVKNTKALLYYTIPPQNIANCEEKLDLMRRDIALD